MAGVVKTIENIELRLSFWEKVGSLHGNLKEPISNLVASKTAANPWSKEVLKGYRAPGTGIPFVILLGTMRYKGGKDFAAIYKKRPVTIYEFKDSPFKRWIITE